MADRFREIRVGERLPLLQVKLERPGYYRYNAMVGEVNPLHIFKSYARRLGFRDIVVAGIFTFSYTPRLVEEWAGPEGRVTAVEIRYEKPAYIEETLVHKAWVTDKSEADRTVEVDVEVEDLAGETLTRARVTALFERAV